MKDEERNFFLPITNLSMGDGEWMVDEDSFRTGFGRNTQITTRTYSVFLDIFHELSILLFSCSTKRPSIHLSPLSLFSPSQRRTVPHLGGILCPKRKERKKEEEMVMKVTRKRTAAWRRIRGKRNVYGDAWTWHDHPLLPWSRCWVQSRTGTKQEEKI